MSYRILVYAALLEIATNSRDTSIRQLAGLLPLGRSINDTKSYAGN